MLKGCYCYNHMVRHLYAVAAHGGLSALLSVWWGRLTEKRAAKMRSYDFCCVSEWLWKDHRRINILMAGREILPLNKSVTWYQLALETQNSSARWQSLRWTYKRDGSHWPDFFDRSRGLKRRWIFLPFCYLKWEEERKGCFKIWRRMLCSSIHAIVEARGGRGEPWPPLPRFDVAYSPCPSTCISILY